MTASMPTPIPTPPSVGRPWWALAVLATAQLMVILDVTIVNIALPAIQQDLGFDDSSRQWTITAYSLAFGALLILGGRLGDRYGRRLAFVVGTIGFAAASLLGGLASGFGVLIAARTVQGASGALMAPAALGLLTVIFEHSPARARAFGIWGAVTGAGGALGLLLGGLLTDYWSWRWCLLVNVGFAALALAGTRLLPAGLVTERPRVTIASAAIVSAGLFGIVFGLSRAESDGWSAHLTTGSLLGGTLLVTLFVLLQLWLPQPLLPLRVFADRYRAGSMVAILTSGAGIFGVFLFLTYFLEETLGYSAARTGVAFLPLLLVLGATATTAGATLLPRTGPHAMVATGMLAAAGALVMMTRFDTATDYAPDVLVPLLVGGFGLGLVFSAAMGTATIGLAEEDAGVGSSLVNTAQQIGGSIGVALLSTQSSAAVEDYLTDRMTLVQPAPTPEVIVDATLAGYHTAFWWAAGFFLFGAAVCALLIPRGRPSRGPSPSPTAPGR